MWATERESTCNRLNGIDSSLVAQSRATFGVITPAYNHSTWVNCLRGVEPQTAEPGWQLLLQIGNPSKRNGCECIATNPIA